MPNDRASTAINENSDNNRQRNSENNRFMPYVIIVGVAAIGLVVIWTLCFWYIRLEKDRVPDFLTAAFGYLILMAMFVQSYIYKRQSDSMNDSLVRTDKLIDQNDATVKQMERQADMAREALVKLQRPFVFIYHICARWGEVHPKVRIGQLLSKNKKT